MKRNDPHRPSAINPAEYEYVGQEVSKCEGFEDVEIIRMERERIAAHMARTGGTYASHQHGGNCQCCGSVNAIYTTLFYHAPTNTYVRFGSTCAVKLDMGNERDFRAIKAAVKDAREAAAGKQKAQATLADAGLTRAWELSHTVPALQQGQPGGYDQWAHMTLCDIVYKLVRYGSISEKQTAFLRTLVDRIDNGAKREAERAAQRAAEKAAATDAPEGRHTEMVEVLSVKEHVSDFGCCWKMFVKSVEHGWTAWGTVPSNVASDRGQRLQLTATFTRAQNDSKHAFFKRPIAREVEQAVAV